MQIIYQIRRNFWGSELRFYKKIEKWLRNVSRTCSLSLAITEIQVTISVGFHLTHTGIAKINSTADQILCRAYLLTTSMTSMTQSGFSSNIYTSMARNSSLIALKTWPKRNIPSLILETEDQEIGCEFVSLSNISIYTQIWSPPRMLYMSWTMKVLRNLPKWIEERPWGLNST